MAYRPASVEGCNNGVVVAGSIVSAAANKKLVKAGCTSMLMRLRASVCKCFALGLVWGATTRSKRYHSLFVLMYIIT